MPYAVTLALQRLRERPRATPAELAAGWERTNRVVAEIAADLTEPTNAVEVIRDVRRDL